MIPNEKSWKECVVDDLSNLLWRWCRPVGAASGDASFLLLFLSPWMEENKVKVTGGAKVVLDLER